MSKPKMGAGLILSRRVGEAVKIIAGGETIVVRVHSQQGQRVRLAILAEPEVRVVRAEIGGDHGSA